MTTRPRTRAGPSLSRQVRTWSESAPTIKNVSRAHFGRYEHGPSLPPTITRTLAMTTRPRTRVGPSLFRQIRTWAKSAPTNDHGRPASTVKGKRPSFANISVS